jgi:hypothetical protein
MSYEPPPFPLGCPTCFRSTVHGSVFAGRDRHLVAVHEGDPVALLPDPPGQSVPEVWVHLPTGDPIGHLPPEISGWLCPWMQEGGRVDATAVRVRGEDAPSWRRVVLEVVCWTEPAEAGGGPV